MDIFNKMILNKLKIRCQNKINNFVLHNKTKKINK